MVEITRIFRALFLFGCLHRVVQYYWYYKRLGKDDLSSEGMFLKEQYYTKWRRADQTLNFGYSLNLAQDRAVRRLRYSGINHIWVNNIVMGRYIDSDGGIKDSLIREKLIPCAVLFCFLTVIVCSLPILFFAFNAAVISSRSALLLGMICVFIFVPMFNISYLTFMPILAKKRIQDWSRSSMTP